MKKQLSYIAAAFLLSGMLTAQKIDINKMPVAGPTPVINIAKPKSFQLNNGLTVMIVENHKLPRVNMSLSMDRPPIYEGAVAGVADVMSDQFENGTMNMSKDEFNKKVDFLGASLGFSSSGASANTLSKYFPQVLSLMSDAVVNPKFSAEEIKTSKERMIEGLKSEEKNASSIASRVSNALTYGKNTSRGEFVTEASINKIGLKDVQDFYNKYYAPDNAYLVIVGDVTMDQVKPMIEKAFGGWKKSNTVFPKLEPASNVATTEIDVVDVPTAVQSVISINNLNNLKVGTPLYFPSMIANYILGGGGEARLFMNLREKNAFTYGAYSSMSPGKYSSEFSAESSVRNEVTDKAVVEFMKELNGISTVKPEELANAKAKLKGDFIRSMESPGTIARFALNQKVQNLPDSFYADYLKSIDAVTAADVTKAVKANILPNQSRIFIAGKASQITEGLEKLGYPVKFFDSQANPVAKPQAQKVDASVSVASVMDKYITAIGGKEALAKINSLTTNASATVQGMALELKEIKAKGGKINQSLSMMGQTMQKMVFDGKDGRMEAQGQKMPIPAQKKEELLKSSEIFPELTLAKAADVKLGGIEKFNNEDCYAVKEGGSVSYYSVKTGLKTGETGDGATTNFSDYKEVSGVKLPFTMTQSMGGQDFEFKVKSYELNKATDADFK
ncbi:MULTISPECIES: M16 family metallopeptidase [Amniculibacterium]|uniref:M16 family metallopeptidase n=1 Tax=Amniculibacterium TaxID=2715289 RepID=UPI000F5A8F33|nr:MULTISPECIES: pitrilysin family protein [Amniculibacterium]